MNAEQLLWQRIQRHLQIRPDGDPGMQTAKAVAAKLGLKMVAVEPSQSSQIWPVDREAEMTKFFGSPGDNLVKITVPYPLYYFGERRDEITVNAKIADAVLRVLQKTLHHYGLAKIKKLKLDQFAGCFNNRPKTGGGSRSTHAWAAALDWAAAENAYKMTSETALFAGAEYESWWSFWEAEGAVSLGRARDFDWMHVQFARLR
jgi:hypothetical protein